MFGHAFGRLGNEWKNCKVGSSFGAQDGKAGGCENSGAAVEQRLLRLDALDLESFEVLSLTVGWCGVELPLAFYCST